MTRATTMKLITAIIRPEQLDDVQHFLVDQGFETGP